MRGNTAQQTSRLLAKWFRQTAVQILPETGQNFSMLFRDKEMISLASVPFFIPRLGVTRSSGCAFMRSPAPALFFIPGV